MTAFLELDVFLVARLGFVCGYAAVTGCVAFAMFWVLRFSGLRAQRPGAWRRDAAFAFLIALAVAIVNWFAGPWPRTLETVPSGTRSYRATATSQAWTFVHPGDTRAVEGVLWAEIDVPLQVLLQVESGITTLRCFALPAARVHRDAIPERFQAVWFKPVQLGDFPIEPHTDCPHANGSPRAILRVVDAATWARSPWR